MVCACEGSGAASPRVQCPKQSWDWGGIGEKTGSSGALHEGHSHTKGWGSFGAPWQPPSWINPPLPEGMSSTAPHGVKAQLRFWGKQRALVQIILAAYNNCFPDNVPLICKCHVGDKGKHFNVTEKFDLGANYFNFWLICILDNYLQLTLVIRGWVLC